MRKTSLFMAVLAVVQLGCAGQVEDGNGEADSALTTTTVEAESMTGNAALKTDATASGGKSITFWGNGSDSRAVAVPALTAIAVVARGDQCNGAPHLVLSVDGVSKLTASVTATAWTTYSATVAVAAGTHTFKVAFDNDYASGCDRNLRVDRLVLTPAGTTSPPPPPNSGAIWEPTDLKNATWTRPSGSGFVTWESLVGSAAASAQAANPSAPVLLSSTFMKSIKGNVVLTLPGGIFEAENGYSHYVNNNMLGLGQGYATGLRGIAGSGSHSTPGPNGAETIVRMRGKVGSPAAFGNLIILNGINNPYLGGFSLIGTQTKGDGVYHGGIMFNTCTGTPIIERMYLRGASPGYANFPPGETFGINIYRTSNAVIRDTEIDGRDVNGTRNCASPIGWNRVENDTKTVNVQRVYTHQGVAGMLTFWETTNLITEDYYTYSWPSGTGALSGSGINHEQSQGRIRHIRPRLFLNGTQSAGVVHGKYGHPAADNTAQTSASGATFSLQNGNTDAGADFEMTDPEWDTTLGSSGLICMNSHDGYALGQQVKTPPRVSIKNPAGVEYPLTKVDHPTSGWSTKPPLVNYAWIH